SIRRHPRLQLAAHPLNAPQRPQIAAEPLQGTDHRKQPHSPHPFQEHIHRLAALPEAAKLQDRPDNNQHHGDQPMSPEQPQLPLPGQTQGRGICKQLRRLWVRAGIDPIVPQDAGRLPPHFPVSLLPLTLGVIGLCPQGLQPIPELPGLRRLKLSAAIARKRHRPPALDSFFLQPPLQKGG
ncbi:Sigma-24, partial [Dysosmobacter welbionis]